MAFVVSSSIAWVRRVAGWCFAVEERLADVVLIGGALLAAVLEQEASAMSALETDGRFEHTARFRDVLAEEYDIGIARHFLRDAADDGISIA